MNVQNLQRRASGVLPVRMEVPRAGTSHRFVKPLVIDEETGVTFRYRGVKRRSEVGGRRSEVAASQPPASNLTHPSQSPSPALYL